MITECPTCTGPLQAKVNVNIPAKIIFKGEILKSTYFADEDINKNLENFQNLNLTNIECTWCNWHQE